MVSRQILKCLVHLNVDSPCWSSTSTWLCRLVHLLSTVVIPHRQLPPLYSPKEKFLVSWCNPFWHHNYAAITKWRQIFKWVRLVQWWLILFSEFIAGGKQLTKSQKILLRRRRAFACQLPVNSLSPFVSDRPSRIFFFVFFFGLFNVCAAVKLYSNSVCHSIICYSHSEVSLIALTVNNSAHTFFYNYYQCVTCLILPVLMHALLSDIFISSMIVYYILTTLKLKFLSTSQCFVRRCIKLWDNFTTELLLWSHSKCCTFTALLSLYIRVLCSQLHRIGKFEE